MRRWRTGRRGLRCVKRTAHVAAFDGFQPAVLFPLPAFARLHRARVSLGYGMTPHFPSRREIYFFFPAKWALNRLHFSKQTGILPFGAFVWVCGCKSKPVAGKTIHVSGQSSVSMVRLRSKTNRETERGSSGEPYGLRSEPSCWRVWGQRPGQPYTGIKQKYQKGKVQCSKTKF